jgi:hypothetical protein
MKETELFLLLLCLTSGVSCRLAVVEKLDDSQDGRQQAAGARVHYQFLVLFRFMI